MLGKTGCRPALLENDNLLTVLTLRAKVLWEIRTYFFEQDVVEVETPALKTTPVSDPHIDSFRVGPSINLNGHYAYLHSSPEYSMKELLAKGSGSIFQICKVFRDELEGNVHLNEFTMLEWYRLEYTREQLEKDTCKLLKKILGDKKVERFSYREAFLKFVDIDPFIADINQLKEAAAKLGLEFKDNSSNKEIWLDLILSHHIEKHFDPTVITILYHYPESQAALSKVIEDKNGYRVAERFEIYYAGMELANGYDELQNYEEQILRIEKDNLVRTRLGKPQIDMDSGLLNALESGLPQCAGVALGVDRLVFAIQK